MGGPAAAALWVIDSDVVIDYPRDQPQAVVFLEGSEQPLAVSAISVAELYAGVRDGEERQQLDTFIGAFTVLPLALQPAQRAGLWRRQYGPSHGTGLACQASSTAPRERARRCTTAVWREPLAITSNTSPSITSNRRSGSSSQRRWNSATEKRAWGLIPEL